MTQPNAASSQPQPDISLQGAVDLSGLGQAPGAAQPQQQAGAPAGEALLSLPDAVVNGGEADLEQFAALSQRMPVLVEMHSASSPDSKALSPVLAEIVRSAEGRLVLLRLDLDAHPTLGNQAQVLALLGGRPAPLFAGNPPKDQLVQVISEVLAVAAQQGLTGYAEITGDADAAAEDAAPAEAPLHPLHQEAKDALERGDIATAKSAYERALAESPADDDAKIGLAQVSLLERLQGKTLEQIRSAAAENPNDIDAQFDVADLDLSGGHVDDAFNRLLGLFTKVDADGKTRVRERLIELFDVVGGDEPRVVRARQRLTSLLFA
jgi:putative thioredoxin